MNNTTILITNIIALSMACLGMYLISYISDWRVMLGLFLFCWSNNIGLRNSILAQVNKLTSRSDSGKI